MGLRVSSEKARGCGYRAAGGTYMVGGGHFVPCGRVPFATHACDACGAGVKPARGWTWIKPAKLLGIDLEKWDCGADACGLCPFGGLLSRDPDMESGLIWVGEKFYATPEDFMAEAREMGISRRITAVPQGFKVGEHYVYLAHRKAIETKCQACYVDFELRNPGEECEECGGFGSIFSPGIFTAFKPTTIEKIVNDDVTDEEVEALEKRGIEAVIVQREGVQ